MSESKSDVIYPVLLVGCLSLGIGAAGAYAGYEVGRHINDVTPTELAQAGDRLQKKTANYLHLAPPQSCGRNVLATVLSTQNVYQPPNTTTLGGAYTAACVQPASEVFIEKVAQSLGDVQQAQARYNQSAQDSDYSTQEKVAYALAGSVVSIIGTPSVVAWGLVHTK
ncbi:MAG TPA: hypothetical protein VJC09_00705 [Candidatus Saccharimonadales bacterium]|nr:hypothetical protein [Candidatus Saccharimonadales bacterium]